ncbi:hypothetical protein C6500_02170 [Candidatus Poribacteria bacterium]|nr:MAG: hypothetical protein C6500_02170 [Candidatus Poribacteria bacterium]
MTRFNNLKNESNPQQSVLSVTAILAIISVVLAAGWIAFAYYKGSANSNRILLLHPIVPILLIVLLIRVYRWIDLKSIVILEILMIVVWIFIRLLGVLTPFILGFGFAYVFRFLWNALPFKARYQRGLATVLIVLVCGGLLFYTGKQVSKQAGQMGSGLLKFYHEIVLPYVVGETFGAVAISVDLVAVEDEDESLSNERNPQVETFYLGTNHGVYEIQQEIEGILSRIGITNGALLGKPIQALAATGNVIYAGTRSGLYRYYKAVPAHTTEAIDGDAARTQNVTPKIWHKVEETPFDTISVQATSIPIWDNTQIYVGTEKGLYNSPDSGKTWREVDPDIYDERSIISIISVADINGDRVTYVASTASIDTTPSEQTVPPPTVTTVHWYLEGSSLEWNLLPSTTHPVHALTGGTWGNKESGLQIPPTRVFDIELYAGTSDGLYGWHRLRNQWEKIAVTEAMTTISVLATVPSGVYAGNDNVLRHRTTPTAKWKPFTTRNQGITYTYRDQPIVQQVKAYLTERIPTIAQTGGQAVREGFQFAGSIAFGFGGFLATVSLAFIVFVYASQSFDNYFRSFIMLVPERHRETVKIYLREIDRNLQQFLKGQVAVIAMVSVISCIAYSIIGVPFALVIGLLAGICNAIPTFGPFIGGGFAYVAMLMGLAAGDFGIVDFLIRSAFVLGAILGIQMLDNSLISPKIMSTAVNVDPLLIMFAVIVGASVLGFWGVLLAIPIIVVVKSVIAVSQSVATDGRLEVNSANDALEEN